VPETPREICMASALGAYVLPSAVTRSCRAGSKSWRSRPLFTMRIRTVTYWPCGIQLPCEPMTSPIRVRTPMAV